MKKGLLFAGTVLFSASAFAGTPVAESAPSRAYDAAMLKSMTTNDSQKESRYSAPKKIVTPDGKFDLKPLIMVPQTPFYGGGISSNGKSIAPIPIPVNTPMIYQGNALAYRAEGVTDRFSDWKSIKYEWNYPNPVTWEDSNEWIAAEKIAVTYSPFLFLTTLPLPTLLATYADEVEETAAPYKAILSGTSTLPLIGKSGNVELEDIGFTTMPWIEGVNPQFNSSQLARFGKGTYNTGETYTDVMIECVMDQWKDAFKNTFDQDLKEMKVKGFGQALPYAGAPYLLKSLTFNGWIQTEKDLTVDLTLLEMDAETMQPTDKVIYSSTFTVDANAENYDGIAKPITMNLQHKDDEGWTINYITIDRPVFFKISGFENSTSVLRFMPMTLGFNYDDDYCNMVESTACVLFDMIGAEGAIAPDYACYAEGAWGNDKDGYYYHPNYYVDVEAEYPILQPTDYIIGDNDETLMEYAEDGDYKIEIEEGVSEIVVTIATSAADADEIVVDVEEEDLPEWISKFGIADGVRYLTSSGLYLNCIELHFQLEGDYTNKSFTVPMTYKTLSAQVTIFNTKDNAVDNIAVDGGNAQYFDLQGRKLNGNPEKGVYILKEGNKASKVIL